MIDYARISHMLAYEQSGVWPLNVTPLDPTTKSVFRKDTRDWEYPLRCYSADERHRGLRGTGRAL